MWNNSYRTLTECWQKTSDFPKGKKIPTYLGRAKEKRKNRDKRIGMGTALEGGSCEGGKEGGKELWRRKCFHTLGSPFTGGEGGWVGGKLPSHRGQHRNRGAEGKVERFPPRGSVPTSSHQPERIVCSPAGVGRGWELRLRPRRSDPRERTEIGCMKKAWGSYCPTASWEGVQEKVWMCQRGKRPLFRGVWVEGIPSLCVHRRQSTT